MELWKNIPNYPGYQASDQGRIRSYWGKGNNPQITKISFIRKQTLIRGYYVINITNFEKKQRAILVHRLILLAFKGLSKKKYGLHKNDIHTDNRIENLYWGSQKQNMKDMYRNGHSLYGEKCPWAKLSNKDIKDIKDYVREGWSITELAKGYEVSHSLVSMIISGRRWNAQDKNV